MKNDLLILRLILRDLLLDTEQQKQVPDLSNCLPSTWVSGVLGRV